MSFDDDLRESLQQRIPANRLHFLDGWRSEWYRSGWAGGRPLALVLHHTAGAATSSQKKAHDGNQHGANDGQIDYVNRHPSYGMPASAFTIDRDGCIFVNAAWPCYHAGEGSFRGTEWASLGCPDDSANSYCMGVECVDKGQSTTFTVAMKQAVALLAVSLADACHWSNTGTLYLPRHKDWAPDRKVDLRYSNGSVQGWLEEHGTLWDGVVPTFEGCMNAWNDPSLANPQAWRIACRLADWGYYHGGAPQPKGVQQYPAKAVVNYQQAKGYDVPTPGQYGPNLHEQLWGVSP
jgi:hypothetical protein